MWAQDFTRPCSPVRQGEGRGSSWCGGGRQQPHDFSRNSSGKQLDQIRMAPLYRVEGAEGREPCSYLRLVPASSGDAQHG